MVAVVKFQELNQMNSFIRRINTHAIDSNPRLLDCTDLMQIHY